MKTSPRLLRALALGSLGLTGCTLGPDYTRPPLATPLAWKEDAHATQPAAPSLPSAWWELFGDTELNRIAEQVVAANHDLQSAAARVDEARALAGLSAADLAPRVSGSASGTRFHASENREPSTPGLTAWDHTARLDLGYEIDFWGRVRRANEAALADAAAVAADWQTARVALTAEAARHYFQVRTLDAERAILEATLALRRDALALQETRANAGLIDETDAARARTEVANVEAELHALARSRARSEHALALLCGQAPAEFALAPRAAELPAPAIPPGLPATLLQRRPDLAAAEHQLAAASARIGVARADFFPRLSLTGSAGFASAELGSLLESGGRTWSFGPSLSLPLFDGGRNRANLAAAEARYTQSAAAYRAAVLRAFGEVEDALSDLGALSAQVGAIDRALAAARDTSTLARERHRRGLSSYLDVVDAERAALSAERARAQLLGQRTLSTIRLAKAVGGGWQNAERHSAPAIAAR